MQLWKAPIQDLWPKEWLGIDWQWGIQSRWVSHTVSCVENKLLVSCLESFPSLPVPLQHTCASQHLCMLHAAPFSQGQETSACENIIAVVWVKTLLSLTWFGKCKVFNVLNNFYCTVTTTDYNTFWQVQLILLFFLHSDAFCCFCGLESDREKCTLFKRSGFAVELCGENSMRGLKIIKSKYCCRIF